MQEIHNWPKYREFSYKWDFYITVPPQQGSSNIKEEGQKNVRGRGWGGRTRVKQLTSGHDTTNALMNSQQLSMPVQIKPVNRSIPAQRENQLMRPTPG